MKAITCFYIICFFVLTSCDKQQFKEKEIVYLYYYYNKMDLGRIECPCDGYYKQRAIFKQDTIFTFGHRYDKYFMASDFIRKEVYIKDGLDLYRLNLKGEKKLFFTIKNNDKIFFERWPVDSAYDFDGPIPGGPQLGYQHRYIGLDTLVNRSKDSVEVYKFLVCRVWYNWDECCNDINDTICQVATYLYYYTKDFLLYKTEYLGDDWEAAWVVERLSNVPFCSKEPPCRNRR